MNDNRILFDAMYKKLLIPEYLKADSEDLKQFAEQLYNKTIELAASFVYSDTRNHNLEMRIKDTFII
jgi:hypothetical protein